MNTKRISHIGVLVHDADAVTRLWTEAFGFQKFEDRKRSWQSRTAMETTSASST